MDLAVKTTRVRATVGEISDALEVAFGRRKAEIRSINGVFGAAYAGEADFQATVADGASFAKEEQRRPPMLVAKMGQDGHDRGAKVISTAFADIAFADIGFDVDVAPLFQTPAEVARDAVQNDVHIVGASSQAAGHKTLVPQLIDELKKAGTGDVLVVCGGVIPAQDYEFLRAASVSGIHGPGTNIASAAPEILGPLRAKG